ncbi:sulfatase-like hydrolase/transferase [Pseudalkalibacillus sp. Hm43]|uniref:sulfatase-like hydrolase/transferase n=1 Tax=Pseudalkalibacillus sp. Hm43 TaxID=3450742 RepID=UPI003F435A02
MNFIFAIALYTLVQLFVFMFDVDQMIDWTQMNTKASLMYLGTSFGVLLCTYKFQIKMIDHINQSDFFNQWYGKLLTTSILLIGSSLLVNLFFQLSQKLFNLDRTIDWIQLNSKLFLMGSFYVFFFALLIYLVIGNPFTSTIIFLLIGITLGYTHYNKLKFRIEPLFPSDFSQIGHMKEVLPMVMSYLSIWTIIILIGLIALFVLALRSFPKMTIKWWKRLIVVPVVLFMIYSFTFYPKTFMKDFVESTSLDLIGWNQLSNYRDNGFVFAFLSNLQGDNFEKPDGYNKKNVVKLAEDLKARYDSRNVPEEEINPNIIYIMNEAFWDPTEFENINLSEDPLPNIRKIQQQYPSGKILSPMFGGGTANVEFEALTGFSMSFVRAGVTPFQNMVDHQNPFPTLASVLKDKGYSTVAIHPYNKVFYKRNRVYDKFGFDSFLHMNSMEFTEKDGSYISDESVTKEIIKELEKSKGPAFIHAVTMQNHFPYLEGRFDENTIEVEGLSQAYKTELEVFVEGIKRSDQATQQLVDYLNTLEEPTMVVFWGDHLPILGTDKAIYKAANYTEGLPPETTNRKYSETPLFIYANYPINKTELGTVSPAFLPPTVMQYAGMDLPPFYSFLEKIKQEIPGLKASLKIGKDGQPIKKLSEEQAQLLKDYKLLEYDLLAGEQYSKDILFE